MGHYLVGQAIEIRLFDHYSRGGWAESLISTLIATAPALVTNNQANLADVTRAVTRASRVDADVGQVDGARPASDSS